MLLLDSPVELRKFALGLAQKSAVTDVSMYIPDDSVNTTGISTAAASERRRLRAYMHTCRSAEQKRRCAPDGYLAWFAAVSPKCIALCDHRLHGNDGDEHNQHGQRGLGPVRVDSRVYGR